MNTEFYDIRGPVDLPSGWWPFALAGLVMAILLFFLFRKRHQPAAKALGPVFSTGKPCWEAALESLGQLEVGHWNTEEEKKQFYSHLSGIVRCYIELRFDLPAPEMTTEEFLERMSGETSFPEADRSLLRDLLIASDLVKFARYGTSAQEMSRSIGLARKYIENTIPRGAIDPAAQGGEGA